MVDWNKPLCRKVDQLKVLYVGKNPSPTGADGLNYPKKVLFENWTTSIYDNYGKFYADDTSSYDLVNY